MYKRQEHISTYSTNSFDDSTDSDIEIQPKQSFNKINFNVIESRNYLEDDNKTLHLRRCQRPILFFKGIHKKQGFKRKSCDNLICMECDIHVSRIHNMNWIDSEPNYLFFRSYFGNKSKIQSKMKFELGKVVFYCGCRGVVLDIPSYSKDLKNPTKWICNGCI